MTYWVDEFDKKIKDKAKKDLEILYKAKSIIINRINYNDEKCAFLKLQCYSDKLNKCIEIIEDELH
jgi:hypothetical protein